jgi:hypothetical protein
MEMSRPATFDLVQVLDNDCDSKRTLDSRPSFIETRSRSRLNDDSSSSHGVAVAMGDFPLALFVAVHLCGPQRIAALLAVDRC